MIVIKPEQWYLIKGETLIVVRYALFNLEEDVRQNDMSAAEIAARLAHARDLLPKTPPEADFI